MVAAVAGQGKLQQAADKAGACFNQGEQAARRHIEPRKGAAQQADGLAHQPVRLVRHQGGVHRQHGGGIAFGLEQPDADVELVGTHLQDGVLQVARHGQRVPGVTGGFDGRDVGRLGAGRGLHGEGGGALGAVDLYRHMGVVQGVRLDRAGHGVELDAAAVGGAVALRCQFQRALLHLLRKHLGLGDIVHQAPVFGFLAAHAFHAGAKNVGQVMAHMLFVGHAGQTAGAGQHTQQRYLGQAHRAGAVVHQNDFVAGQRQLIATAGTGTVHGSQEFEPAVRRRVFQAVAGFVGEFAEVDFPGVAAHAQHEDIGAGAEHLFFGAGDDHGAHLRVLEADAADGVVELDVHAQVVAVELELVAGAQTSVFIKVGLECGHWAVEAQFPVLVLGRVGLVIDTTGMVHDMVSWLDNEFVLRYALNELYCLF